jgi:hypothetical protein
VSPERQSASRIGESHVRRHGTYGSRGVDVAPPEMSEVQEAGLPVLQLPSVRQCPL